MGCLHSHYTNIDYIEKSLSKYDLDMIHFVDPGLMHRISHDEAFQTPDAEKKVYEQLEWMAQSGLDAILITCTNYIALIKEEELSLSIPVIKIDEPYFEYICNIEEPQTILFTNPATVDGTMKRLNQFAKEKGKTIDVEVKVLNDTFELMMKGRKEEYTRQVARYINIILEDRRIVSVAQLSMVDAAKQVEEETNKPIINPLNKLINALVKQLEL